MLVILLPATESAMEDAYEFCLTLDDVDETDPCLGWYLDTGDRTGTLVWILGNVSADDVPRDGDLSSRATSDGGDRARRFIPWLEDRRSTC
jgi:hypothetical protein